MTETVSKDSTSQDQNRRDLFELDRVILLEIIKLSRFNIHFRLEANYHWPGRAWLYPLGQEAGTACIFANNVTDLSQRARGLNDPRLISRRSRKRGAEAAIVGSAIRGTSSAAELLQNTYVAWHARQLGFSPRALGSLFERIYRQNRYSFRTAPIMLGNAESLYNKPLFVLEGHLFKHIRNQLLYEFENWSIQSRAQEWRENTFFAIDAVRNFIGMSAGIQAIKGFNHSGYRGSAAITTIVSSTMATVNPWVRDLAALAITKYQRKRLSEIFAIRKPKTLEQLVKDWDDLDQVMSGNIPENTDKKVLREIAMLTKKSQDLDSSMVSEDVRIQRLRRVAAQQAISGPLIGTTILARAICSTVAYYGYRKRPVVANRIAFAGRVTESTGLAYSLVATPVGLARRVHYERKLAKKGTLPRQILLNRLKELDDLEAQVAGFKF